MNAGARTHVAVGWLINVAQVRLETRSTNHDRVPVILSPQKHYRYSSNLPILTATVKSGDDGRKLKIGTPEAIASIGYRPTTSPIKACRPQCFLSKVYANVCHSTRDILARLTQFTDLEIRPYIFKMAATTLYLEALTVHLAFR